MAKKRTNRDLLCCIEQKVIEHGKDISTLGRDMCALKDHFENHLTEHKQELKEKLKLHWAIYVVILSTLFSAMGSLIVGGLLFFFKIR